MPTESFNPANPPRYTVQDMGNALLISIPSPKIWIMILFLGMFAATGYPLGFVVIPQMLSAPFYSDGGAKEIFLSFLWIILVVRSLYHLLWSLVGKEEVEITPELISISQVILFFSWSHKYLSTSIKGLRTAPEGRAQPYSLDDDDDGFDFQKGDGIIAFEYEGRTIRVGIGIDEAEGKQIITEIRRRFPNYQQGNRKAYPMDTQPPDHTEFVIRELARHHGRDDIILALCEWGGLKLDEAAEFVRRVESEQAGASRARERQ